MSDKELYVRSSAAEFLIFELDAKENSIQVRYENENLWLTQKAMAELFNCSIDNISLHLKNIFESGELDKETVIEKYSTTASDGKNYNMNYYNKEILSKSYGYLCDEY